MKTLLLLLLLIPQFAFAANPDTIQEILQLTRDIRNMAPTSTASDGALSTALAHLQEARALIASQDNPAGECYDVAYEAYSSTYGQGATATEKAMALCRNVEDADALRFLYGAYAQTYGQGATAIEKAAMHKGLSGKVDMLGFCYDAYSKTYGVGATAVGKAATGAAKLKFGSLPCLERLYDGYSKTYGQGATAIEKSIEGCR